MKEYNSIIDIHIDILSSKIKDGDTVSIYSDIDKDGNAFKGDYKVSLKDGKV